MSTTITPLLQEATIATRHDGLTIVAKPRLRKRHVCRIKVELTLFEYVSHRHGLLAYLEGLGFAARGCYWPQSRAVSFTAPIECRYIVAEIVSAYLAGVNASPAESAPTGWDSVTA